jgi:hypothetical protein
MSRRSRSEALRSGAQAQAAMGWLAMNRAGQVAVEETDTTVDHSDIRGSKPHNRDSSGAASNYGRESDPQDRLA